MLTAYQQSVCRYICPTTVVCTHLLITAFPRKTNAMKMSSEIRRMCGIMSHKYATQIMECKLNKNKSQSMRFLKGFIIAYSKKSVGLFRQGRDPQRLTQWTVPQLSIRINYNGTWSILIQWLIGVW